MHVRLQLLAALPGVVLMAGCGHPSPPANGGADATRAAPDARPEGCFLAARIKGALEAAIDWRGDALLCEGGARPEGRGLRASFAGKGPQGEALRIVFGLAARPGAGESRDVATHLTLIVEGSGKLYATQGAAQCTTELLQQVPPAAQPGQWRVRARGYCIDPAATLDGNARLYMERFDFQGVAHFDPEDLDAPPKP